MKHGFLTIRAEHLAVAQLMRAAEHARMAADDPYRLLDVVRCMHLSIISALTAALTDTSGLGALDKRSTQQELQDDDNAVWNERTMPYAALLEAAQKPGGLGWGGTLHLSPDEQKAATRLDHLRGLIDHPKPTTWSVPANELRAVSAALSPLVRRALKEVWHHVPPDLQKELAAAEDQLAAL